MRLDVYLCENGYAESRTRAKFLIGERAVTVDGAVADRASADIDGDVPHEIEVRGVCPYVSVGGMKLKAAFDRFGFSPSGLVCADIGSSTGGFTDCLLQHGASCVYAVDSGTSQLHPSLRRDARVTVMENCNARYLSAEKLGERCGLAVCDVSFISQRLIIPAIADILADDGTFITLIKPQFELDRRRVGKGVVTSPADRANAVVSVISSAALFGFRAYGITVSPVSGGGIEAAKRGNREYLAIFDRCGGEHFSEYEIRKFIYGENSVNTAVRHKEQ